MGLIDNVRRALTGEPVAKSEIANITPIDNPTQFMTSTDYQDASLDSSGQPRKFSPGTPLRPADGYSVNPRQRDFLTAYNVAARPRRNEPVAFSTLKAIVDAYDIAQIAINHRIDSIRSLDYYLEPKAGITGDLSASIAYANEVLRKPDHVQPFHSWLHSYLWDVLAYDAGTLYRMRNRAGKAVGLQIVDGTTIAPLLDYYGRRPAAPAPAFVQFAQGIPWAWLTADDIIYQPFRPIPSSPYGRSPLETILLNANTDLRFQHYFLQRFTEGTMPEGFATAPETWTPDQIADFQETWEAFLRGDTSAKHQIKWVPNGTSFTFPKEEAFSPEFSLFLMRKTAAAFHVTPTDLGFTDDVNRATSDTQSDIQFRIGDLPLIQHVQNILTDFIQEDLGLPLNFRFNTGREVEDRLQTAQTNKLYVDMGAISASEVRQDVFGLTEPDGVAVPRIIMTGAGPIPLNALLKIAGVTDPETGAPMGGETPNGNGGFEPAKALNAVLTATPAPAVVPISPTGALEATGGMSVGGEAVSVTEGLDEAPIGGDETAEELVKAELAQFRRFVKARRKSGSWRDFQFSAIDTDLAKQLNEEARTDLEAGSADSPKA